MYDMYQHLSVELRNILNFLMSNTMSGRRWKVAVSLCKWRSVGTHLPLIATALHKLDQRQVLENLYHGTDNRITFCKSDTLAGNFKGTFSKRVECKLANKVSKKHTNKEFLISNLQGIRALSTQLNETQLFLTS